MGKYKSKFNRRKKVFTGIRRQDKENVNVDGLNFARLDSRPSIPFAPIDQNTDQHNNNNNESDKILANQPFYNDFKAATKLMDLIDVQELSKVIYNNLRCGQCTNRRCLELTVTKRSGLASWFELKCTSCPANKKFSNSETRVYEAKGNSWHSYP